MATTTQEPFLLGITYLDLRRPDAVLAVICCDDEACLLPIFRSGHADALALLVTRSVAEKVFSSTSTLLESAERNDPIADECATSYAIARWDMPGDRVLLIGADTAGRDTAQHALHICLGDFPSIARFQSSNFHFAYCTQPYLSSAANALWKT